MPGGRGLSNRIQTTQKQEPKQISLELLERDLADISTVLPISKTAIDVYHMTREGDWRLSQIAAAIQRDASLSAEVLRLANSSYYNPSSKRVVSLEQAVMAIGQKRVGELAMTINALAMATPSALPWMNLELAWKRSMAAGIALEMLIDAGGHSEIEEGLPLSAIMYPLGRVILGTMFPDHYQDFISQSWRTGAPLQEQERTRLPVSHSGALAQLLTSWRIPSDVALPLRYAADDFVTLAKLSDPLRLKTELIKVALIVGRLALSHWETWDTVDLPTNHVLTRINVPQIDRIVTAVRGDVAKLAAFSPGRADAPPERTEPVFVRPIPYCNLEEGATDLFAEILPSMGVCASPVEVAELRMHEGATVINGLDSPATRFAAYRGAGPSLAVTMRDKTSAYSKFAPTIALPCSYGRLREAILEILELASTLPRESGSPVSS
jgi:HD-like signal output (HDOD) protein